MRGPGNAAGNPNIGCRGPAGRALGETGRVWAEEMSGPGEFEQEVEGKEAAASCKGTFGRKAIDGNAAERKKDRNCLGCGILRGGY